MPIFSRLKILPALVVVAMLAFSVRLADVVIGVSSLASTAHAEEKAHEESADDHHAASNEDAGEMEMAAASQEDMKDSESGDDAHGDLEKPMEGEMEFDEPIPDDKWQDAGDSDMDYSQVKKDVYEDLVARRKMLEDREKQLMTREALLRAAEKELDQKYKELNTLRQKIENLLEDQSEAEQGRIASLVKIYEGMKPKEAARIFDTLDLDILISVISKMSERKASAVLAVMNPERARTVTIMLAEQKQLPSLPQ